MTTHRPRRHSAREFMVPTHEPSTLDELKLELKQAEEQLAHYAMHNNRTNAKSLQYYKDVAESLRQRLNSVERTVI